MLKATTKTYLFWAARQCQTLAHPNASLNIEVSEGDNLLLYYVKMIQKLFQLRFNFNKFATPNIYLFVPTKCISAILRTILKHTCFGQHSSVKH